MYETNRELVHWIRGAKRCAIQHDAPFSHADTSFFVVLEIVVHFCLSTRIVND